MGCVAGETPKKRLDPQHSFPRGSQGLGAWGRLERGVVPQCAWGMGAAVTVHPTSSLQRHYDFRRLLSDALTLREATSCSEIHGSSDGTHGSVLVKVKRGGPSHALTGHGPEDFSVGHRHQPICPMRNQVPESLRNLPKVTGTRAGKLKDPDVQVSSRPSVDIMMTILSFMACSPLKQVLGGRENVSLFPSEDLPTLSRSWKSEAGPHRPVPRPGQRTQLLLGRVRFGKLGWRGTDRGSPAWPTTVTGFSMSHVTEEPEGGWQRDFKAKGGCSWLPSSETVPVPHHQALKPLLAPLYNGARRDHPGIWRLGQCP